MEGDISNDEHKGIIPRTVEALFDGVSEADENIEFMFKVSYVEIYLEKIRDLLDPHRVKNNLAIREVTDTYSPFSVLFAHINQHNHRPIIQNNLSI